MDVERLRDDVNVVLERMRGAVVARDHATFLREKKKHH